VTYQQYRPSNPVARAQKVTILLPAWSSQTLYLLDQALISIKVKIVQADGTALPNNTQCSTVNNILGSVFQDCKIFFNDKAVTSSGSNYHIRNYVEATINYDSYVKSTWLQTNGYVEGNYLHSST
jgi:hypothetical protein